MSVIGNLAYVFGGQDEISEKNDMWTFDAGLVSWHQIPTTGTIPGTRYGHCMVRFNNTFVIFGGRIGKKMLNDLYFFDIDTKVWNGPIVATNAPPGRAFHICGLQGTMFYVMYGKNENNTRLSDSMSIDLALPTNGWKLESFNATTVSRAASAKFKNFVIWFGGETNSGFSNSLWDAELKKIGSASFIDIRSTTTGIESPPQMSGHSISLVGTFMFLFGGRTNANPISVNPDLFRYDIESLEWKIIIPVNTPPPSRYKHAMATVGNNLFIYGGLTGTNEVTDDLWLYSVDGNTWTYVEFRNTDAQQPSPRYDHIMETNGTHLFVFGGRNFLKSFSDFYSYDINLHIWTRLHTENAPKYSAQCASSMPDKHTIVLTGCSDISNTLNNLVYSLDIQTMEWFLPYEIPITSASTLHSMVAINADLLAVFGGFADASVNNKLYFVSRGNATQILPYKENAVPAGRAEHKMLYFADRLIVFGGVGGLSTTSQVKSDGRLLGDVQEFRLGPICSSTIPSDPANCIKCSHGTYEYHGICIPCPKGSYNDDIGAIQCKKCGIGFYNPLQGTYSIDSCLPCPFGTFSNKNGSALCEPCIANMHCPIGASEALKLSASATLGGKTLLFSDQPITRESRDSTEYNVQFYGFSTLIILSVLYVCSMGVCLKIKPFATFSSYIRFCDRFSSQHNRKQGVMIKWKNALGGMFSAVSFAATLFLVIISIMAFSLNNNVETRAVVPSMSVSGALSPVEMILELKLIGYPGKCLQDLTTNNCSSLISVASQFCSASRFSCRQEGIPYTLNSNCSITYYSSKCVFTPLQDFEAVTFLSQENQAYALAYEATATLTSGYLTQRSLTRVTTYAPDNFFFKGSQIPTIATFQLIPSIYEETQTANTSRGYHVDFTSVKRGDMTNEIEFNLKRGVSFQYQFSKAAYTYTITLSPKRIWYRFIAELLGQVAGVVSFIGLLLLIIEIILFQIQKRIPWTKSRLDYLTTSHYDEQERFVLFKSRNQELNEQLVDDQEPQQQQ